MAFDLALGASTAALIAIGSWRGGLRLTAVNTFQIAWVVLIALPALLRYAGVATVAKERFFIATAIVNVALCTAVLVRGSPWFDRVLGAPARRAASTSREPESEVPRWAWGLLVLSLIIFSTHAALMPKIPLLELLFHPGLTAGQLTAAREASDKLLPVPLPLKYLFLWNQRVIVPIVLCMFLLSGSAAIRAVVVPALVVLSAMTLEKSFPTFAILSAGLGVATFRHAGLLSRPVVVGVIVALGVSFALSGATRFHNTEPRRSTPAVATPQHPDAGRAPAQPGRGTTPVALQIRRLALHPFEFAYHRILASPSDVAYAWFEYFPDRFGGFLRGRSWNMFARLQPGFQHPANLVAIYAYQQRDTTHYLPTVYAYAAFHADAWANFGYPGVIGACILAGAVLLIGDAAVALSDSPLTAGASGAAVSILATTLTAGGLQAALVAQGLLPCLMIALMPVWGYRAEATSAWGRSVRT